VKLESLRDNRIVYLNADDDGLYTFANAEMLINFAHQLYSFATSFAKASDVKESLGS